MRFSCTEEFLVGVSWWPSNIFSGHACRMTRRSLAGERSLNNVVLLFVYSCSVRRSPSRGLQRARRLSFRSWINRDCCRHQFLSADFEPPGIVFHRFWNKARYWPSNANFSYLLVFLHDPLEPLQIFFQKFNTKCPSLWAIRWCKNIAEKSNPV